MKKPDEKLKIAVLRLFIILSLIIGLFVMGIQSESMNQPKTIEDYFKAFPHKPKSISLIESDHVHPIVDIKNAYLSVAYDDANYDYKFSGEIQFTYFIPENGKLLFAYSDFFDGPESYSATIDFYELENGKWVKPKRPILPTLSLQDFGLSEAADSIGSNFTPRYQLPQYGTDVIVKPYPVGETDSPYSQSPNSYGIYLQQIKSLNSLKLVWNKKEGSFSIKSAK
jgi:hypothetical protein